jgi:peptide/nickel transport system substrate-binding protein
VNRNVLFSMTGKVTAAAAVAVVALALTACAEGTPDSSASGDTTALTVALSQNPDTLDPGATGLVSVNKIATQIFDTLIYRTKDTDDWQAGLATDMQVNEDATEYTFTLRDDVTFQDGTPFNAEAVKATYDHIVDPDTKSLSAKGALGDYKETVVVDDHTAKVVFNTPAPAFYNLASDVNFGISSPTAMEKYGTEYGQHPVGTGPFTFVSYTSDSEVVLEANEDYAWGPSFYGDGASAIKDLTFRILTDQSAQMNALTTGEVDIADNLTPQDVTSALDSGKTEASAGGTGIPYGYLLNTQLAPTDDVLVRQAIVHAVDSEAIIATLFEGQYDAATSVLTADIPGYVDGSDDYEFDADLSADLLDEAGWELGSDGIREKEGQPLEIQMIDIANYGFDSMSALVQAQLKEVGISAEISQEAYPAVATTYNSGAQNTADFFYWGADPTILVSIFGCDNVGSGFNWALYCDEATDAAMEVANTTGDATERIAAFNDIVSTLNEQAVFIPVYDLKTLLVTDGIEGISFTIKGIPLYAGIGK